MKGFISEVWWIVLLRGIALMLFGLVAVVWPGLTFVTLVLAFSIYILISGVMNMLAAIGAIAHKRSWFITLLLGILEVIVGVYLLKSPSLAVESFIIAVGLIFLVQGIFTLIASFVDTTDTGMRVLEIVSGILGILAGFFVLRNPVSGGIAFAWVLGVYGLIVGTITVASALSFRETLGDFEKAVKAQRR